MTRLRHDRTGELVEVDDTDGHRCDRGWLTPAADGSPRPCLDCKPHLRRAPTLITDTDRERIHRGVQQCRAAIRPTPEHPGDHP